jgi:hypothetical protein
VFVASYVFGVHAQTADKFEARDFACRCEKHTTRAVVPIAVRRAAPLWTSLSQPPLSFCTILFILKIPRVTRRVLMTAINADSIDAAPRR